MQEADTHIAGTSCVDYSPRGTQGGDRGPTFVAFLAWIGMRLELQEAIIVHENVQQFDPAALVAYLGCLYYVDSAVLNPEREGWPVARVRRYTILRHKFKTTACRCSWMLGLTLKNRTQ